MRGFAASLALAGAAFSLKAAIDDPNGLSVAKAGVDATSAVQRMSDLLRSLGVENSVIRGAGGGWKLALRTGAKIGAAELLALASTMIEGAKTIRHLSKGEIGDAAFSAGIAVGGAISMLPVFIQTGFHSRTDRHRNHDCGFCRPDALAECEAYPRRGR
jgi:hypothetical protein